MKIALFSCLIPMGRDSLPYFVFYTGKQEDHRRCRGNMGTTVHRVLIVGDSLFAEAVGQLLGHNQAMEVTGIAMSIAEALAQLARTLPDVVLVLNSGPERRLDPCPLLVAYPDLPILYADLSGANFRILRSQPIGTRAADLLAAIQALPIRR